jgi:DNA-binding NarL/FixJ family response regulator
VASLGDRTHSRHRPFKCAVDVDVLSDLNGQATSIQEWRSDRSLTLREREVAQLIARGYSNRQIAEELVIASSTAERHVANILTKLKVRSRAEIAVWAVEHGSPRSR